MIKEELNKLNKNIRYFFKSFYKFFVKKLIKAIQFFYFKFAGL